MASGTFSAAGTSATVVINTRADVSLNFSGTGTVQLQRNINSGWRNVPDGRWTADAEDVIFSGSQGRQYRLRCTAVESGETIDWEIS